MLKFLPILLFPISLLAQTFEGTIHIQTDSDDMMYHMKDANVRFDIHTDEGLVSILMNRDEQKIMLLIETSKMSMEMSLPSDDIETELVNSDSDLGMDGYVKTGRTKQIAGVDCEEWKKDNNSSVWTPTTSRFGSIMVPNAPGLPNMFNDFPGVAFFPFEVIDEHGETKWLVTLVNPRTLPETLFDVPTGWGSFKMNFGN